MTAQTRTLSQALHDIDSEIRTVRSEFRTISEGMATYAAHLQTVGSAPPAALLERVGEIPAKLAVLRSRLVEVASTFRLPVLEMSSGTPPLSELSGFLLILTDELERNDQQSQDAARAVLTRVLALRAPNAAGSLEPVLDRARRLLEAMDRPEERDTVVALAAGTDVFCSLLTLAARYDELSLEDYEAHSQHVEAELGRQIAREAGRGRLRSEPEPVALKLTVSPDLEEPKHGQNGKTHPAPVVDTEPLSALPAPIEPPPAPAVSGLGLLEMPRFVAEPIIVEPLAPEPVVEPAAELAEPQTARAEPLIEAIPMAPEEPRTTDVPAPIHVPEVEVPKAPDEPSAFELRVSDLVGAIATSIAGVRARPGTHSNPELPSLHAGDAPRAPEKADVAEPASASAHSHQATGVLGIQRARAPTERPGATYQCRVGVNTDAKHHARTLLAATKRSPASLLDLVLLLVRDDRIPLSFQLADNVRALHPELTPSIAPSLVGSIALARKLRRGNGPVSAALSEAFGSLLAGGFDESEADDWSEMLRLLLISATLPAALLAPATEAPRLLRMALPLPHDLHGLTMYCEVVAEFGDQAVPFAAHMLGGDQADISWSSDIAKLHADLTLWRERATAKTIIYQAASVVWLRLISPGGDVQKMLAPVIDDDPDKSDMVRDEITRLSNLRRLRKVIDTAHNEVNARKSSERIVGPALQRLIKLVQEAVDFSKRWLEIQENRPASVPRWRIERAQRLRDDLHGLRESVQADIAQIEARAADSALLAAGVSQVKQMLQHMSWLVNSGAFTFEEPDLAHVLHAPLLLSPDIRLSSRFEAVAPAEDLTRPLIELATMSDADWRAGFEARTRALDHAGSAMVLEHMKVAGADAKELEPLEKSREKALARDRERLRHELDRVQLAIDESIAFGLLREQESLEMSASIDDKRRRFEDICDIGAALKDLEEIQSVISERKQSIAETLSKELRRAGLDPAHADSKRIMSLVKEGDLLTAQELLAFHDEGVLEGLGPGHNLFARFFPTKLDAIQEQLAKLDGDRARQKETFDQVAKGRGQVCSVSLSSISSKEGLSAADMMHAWFEAKSWFPAKGPVGVPQETVFRKIFETLGFKVRRVTVHADVRPLELDLETDPIEEKKRALLPAYGSMACIRQRGTATRAEYRVLCYWDRPSPEIIFRDLGDTALKQPTIVFLFSRLSQLERRELASLSRGRRETVIVADDTLMMYLCGVRGDRLPAFFALTLPLSFSHPYAAAAGFAAPEMFYGRRMEIGEVASETGSNYVFGGRQLGKTALLLTVERQRHNPAKGHIAIYLEILDVGYPEPLDSIWTRIAKRLAPFGVVQPDATTANAVLGQIEHWLSEDGKRRVLLLLDEADRFLRFDGISETGRVEGRFMRCARMTRLRDQTGGRFKFVFAGLHNVMRTAMSANSPVHRFNDPLCVGPLFGKDNAQDARDLIVGPFRALGYEFDRPYIVLRILRETNWYPSLIQLYCKHLLDHVNAVSAKGWLEELPYRIKGEHLDEVVRDPVVREAFRRRFLMTLELDPRYEVIVYSIAYLILESGYADGMTAGFDAAMLLESARSFWTEGFDDVDETALTVLLDEMVQLGALRKCRNADQETNDAPARYTLRNANLFLLLGSLNDIVNALARKRQREPDFEPSRFRAPLVSSGSDRLTLRSPLSAQQEALLRGRSGDSPGVVQALGCPASGIEELSVSIASAVGREDSLFLRLEDFPDLDAALVSIETAPDTVTVACISAREWLGAASFERARAVVETRRSAGRPLNIALTTTTTTLDTIQRAEADSDLVARPEHVLRLGPWDDEAVRLWMKDLGAKPADIERFARRLSVATGNWPLFLSSVNVRRRKRASSWEEAVIGFETALTDPVFIQRVLTALGLVDPATRKYIQLIGELVGTDDSRGLEEDFIADYHEVASEVVARSLRRAQLLSLVREAGPRMWSASPLTILVSRATA